jgi:putative protease
MQSNVEVMAPVGSFESLQAAIQAGTDSVYFGIAQLNMRARSSINFTLEDLKEIVARCKKAGVRTYLTVNTILYDHDLILMRRIIDSAKEEGVDAIIAMDQAAIMHAREVNMPIHISTQLNVTNIETVKFYAPYADVMVLSRELTLSQVKKICREIEKQKVRGPSGELIRIEVFAHGALCMAVSGKCYLSLHTHNSSANRGACKQNCRRTYEVKDEEGNELLIDNEFIMSPKDLCTIDFLDKLLDAGISVLKIEGRSKGADYVYETTSCYKEAVTAVQDGTFSREKVGQWMDRLAQIYNRGFWSGYYLGQKLGEWTDAAGSKAVEKKSFLGVGIKYFGNIRIGEFKLQSGQLAVGDEIMITGPTTGLLRTVVQELRVENESVERIARRGVHFSMPIAEKIRPSDKLFLVEK